MTGETILYLSDRATNSNSVLAALKATGYEVVSTNSATQAIALLYMLRMVVGVVLTGGRGNRTPLTWHGAYERFARKFRSFCCAVTRSTACRHPWMLAWIPNSHSKNSPPRCGVCW